MTFNLFFESIKHNKMLTMAMAFREVSEPRVKSVPGTLFDMVAGMMVSGMQNSLNLSRFSTNCSALSKA